MQWVRIIACRDNGEMRRDNSGDVAAMGRYLHGIQAGICAADVGGKNGDIKLHNNSRLI